MDSQKQKRKEDDDSELIKTIKCLRTPVYAYLSFPACNSIKMPTVIPVRKFDFKVNKPSQNSVRKYGNGETLSVYMNTKHNASKTLEINKKNYFDHFHDDEVSSLTDGVSFHLNAFTVNKEFFNLNFQLILKFIEDLSIYFEPFVSKTEIFNDCNETPSCEILSVFNELKVDNFPVSKILIRLSLLFSCLNKNRNYTFLNFFSNKDVKHVLNGKTSTTHNEQFQSMFLKSVLCIMNSLQLFKQNNVININLSKIMKRLIDNVTGLSVQRETTNVLKSQSFIISGNLSTKNYSLLLNFMKKFISGSFDKMEQLSFQNISIQSKKNNTQFAFYKPENITKCTFDKTVFKKRVFSNWECQTAEFKTRKSYKSYRTERESMNRKTFIRNKSKKLLKTNANKFHAIKSEGRLKNKNKIVQMVMCGTFGNKNLYSNLKNNKHNFKLRDLLFLKTKPLYNIRLNYFLSRTEDKNQRFSEYKETKLEYKFKTTHPKGKVEDAGPIKNMDNSPFISPITSGECSKIKLNSKIKSVLTANYFENPNSLQVLENKCVSRIERMKNNLKFCKENQSYSNCLKNIGVYFKIRKKRPKSMEKKLNISRKSDVVEDSKQFLNSFEKKEAETQFSIEDISNYSPIQKTEVKTNEAIKKNAASQTDIMHDSFEYFIDLNALNTSTKANNVEELKGAICSFNLCSTSFTAIPRKTSKLFKDQEVHSLHSTNQTINIPGHITFNDSYPENVCISELIEDQKVPKQAGKNYKNIPQAESLKSDEKNMKKSTFLENERYKVRVGLSRYQKVKPLHPYLKR